MHNERKNIVSGVRKAKEGKIQLRKMRESLRPSYGERLREFLCKSFR